MSSEKSRRSLSPSKKSESEKGRNSTLSPRSGKEDCKMEERKRDFDLWKNSVPTKEETKDDSEYKLQQLQLKNGFKKERKEKDK